MFHSDVNDLHIIEIDTDVISKAILTQLPKFEFDFILSEVEKSNYRQYIRNMSEIGWPAYMDGDLDFHKTINALFKDGKYEEIIEAIYAHYDSNYIDELSNQIQESYVIKKERVPIILEALELYNLGYYYGSVTTLLSQIIGIVKDIECFCKEKNIQFNPENEKLLLSRYNVSKNSDKKRIIAALLEGMDRNDEEREYLYLIGYFRSIIFHNDLKYESQLTTDVNRNMVLHGEQLTFGSKEQALKLIICIESLCWVSEVLSED